MKLQTDILIAPFPFSIAHADRLVSVGSCFSDHIGNKFHYHGFSILSNPFGQQYNPLSIDQGLDRIISNIPFEENDFFLHQSLYHSFAHHSSFSGSSLETVKDNVNKQLHQAHEQLKQAKFLFITYGTAEVFRLKSTGKVVANCHKLPADQFEQTLCTAQEMIHSFEGLFQRLSQFNPDLKMIFSVSPIRYLANGHFQNSLSKGKLFSLIQQHLSHKNCFYFPSYEIVMDELRDYRFYDSDLLHPSALAIDYIWEKLAAVLFSQDTKKVCEEVNKLRKALAHRPFQPDSEKHQAFEKNLKEQKKILEQKLNIIL